MPDQEETLTDEAATESPGEPSAEEDAPEPETEASAGDDAAEAEASAVEAASTPRPSRDPAVAAAVDHLDGVDMEQEREAVDKLAKDLDP